MMGAACDIPPRRGPMALLHRIAPRSRLCHVAHYSSDVTTRDAGETRGVVHLASNAPVYRVIPHNR